MNLRMQVKPALFCKSLPTGHFSKTVLAQVSRHHGTNSDTDQSSTFLLGSNLAGRFSMTRSVTHVES